MTLETIYKQLLTLDMPVAYYSYPEELAPPLPYLIYFNPDSETFSADNRTYIKNRRIIVELYTIQKNTELEKKVEVLLHQLQLPFSVQETYIDSEKMFMVSYEFYIEGEIING